jgi:hypothetical protein
MHLMSAQISMSNSTWLGFTHMTTSKHVQSNAFTDLFFECTQRLHRPLFGMHTAASLLCIDTMQVGAYKRDVSAMYAYIPGVGQNHIYTWRAHGVSGREITSFTVTYKCIHCHMCVYSIHIQCTYTLLANPLCGIPYTGSVTFN